MREKKCGSQWSRWHARRKASYPMQLSRSNRIRTSGHLVAVKQTLYFSGDRTSELTLAGIWKRYFLLFLTLHFRNLVTTCLWFCRCIILELQRRWLYRRLFDDWEWQGPRAVPSPAASFIRWRMAVIWQCLQRQSLDPRLDPRTITTLRRMQRLPSDQWLMWWMRNAARASREWDGCTMRRTAELGEITAWSAVLVEISHAAMPLPEIW